MRRPGLAFQIGLGLSAVLVVVAAVSLVWTPDEPTRMHILARLQGPSASHLLGTDQFGRDVLSMLMVGARNALLVSLVSVGAGGLVGLAIGLAAAVEAESVADQAAMRLMDFTFAFPALLSAVMLSAVFGPGVQNAIVAIAVFNVPVFARLARAGALAAAAREFVTAARALGASRTRIVLRHILPQVAGLLLVQASIQCALAILAEAGLSYLGLGTQPPNPSWGRMLSEAQTFLDTQPLLAVFPGLAIALAVLAFNLVGDGLRDMLDPRLARRAGPR